MGAEPNKIRLKACFCSLGGFLFLVLLLNLMNGSVKFDKKKNASIVSFKTKKVKKKQQQKIQKKKIVKQRSKKLKSLKPKIKMAFAASGMDLGIDILGLSAADSRLLSQQGETVMTEDTVDQLPEVQYREPIPYPESAKDKNLKGHVTVNILINKSGDVGQVKLLDSSPEGVFDQVAISGVRTWSFTPAQYKGQAVAVWVKQKLKFQVN